MGDCQMSTFSMEQNDLKDIFDRLKHVLAVSDVKPIDQGIHFVAAPNGTLLAEALDGYHLGAVIHKLLQAPADCQDFVIEPFAVPKADPVVPARVEVTVDAKSVEFAFSNFGTKEVKSVRKLEGEFLNTAAALPSTEPTLQILFNPRYLKDAITMTEPKNKREKVPVRLSFYGDGSLSECIVSCQNRLCMVLPVRSSETNLSVTNTSMVVQTIRNSRKSK